MTTLADTTNRTNSAWEGMESRFPVCLLARTVSAVSQQEESELSVSIICLSGLESKLGGGESLAMDVEALSSGS